MGRKALPIAAAAPLTEAVEQLHRKKKIAKKQMKLTISLQPPLPPRPAAASLLPELGMGRYEV